MKYTKTERLQIGQHICDGEYSVPDAAQVYGISFYTAREYLRTYKAFRRYTEEQDVRSAARSPGKDADPADVCTDACGGEGEASQEVPADPEARFRRISTQMSREELEKAYVTLRIREERIRRLLKQTD